MIQFDNAGKVYRQNGRSVTALDGAKISIGAGEFAVIRGHSGSGKTTLLFMAGGMLRPSMGRVLVDGADLYGMGHRERARFRAENIGFVFQMFHLVPYLTVRENVRLASGPSGKKASAGEVDEWLERLGIAHRAHHRPAELSAGEKQRAAIARAVINRPKLILADEPTGNLDPDNAAAVFGFLSEYRQQGGTVLVVTHGEAAAEFAGRVVQLENGKILE